MPIRFVAFDVGEVLVDETRLWGEWADWLGVSRLTFSAVLGAVIAEGRHHLDAFELLRPASTSRSRGGRVPVTIGGRGWSQRISIPMPCPA
jgi:hypothetical protein